MDYIFINFFFLFHFLPMIFRHNLHTCKKFKSKSNLNQQSNSVKIYKINKIIINIEREQNGAYFSCLKI